MRLAHISDLHFSRKAFIKPTKNLVASLIQNSIDTVLLTGDITESGTDKQYSDFQTVFVPLIDAGKLISVVGNHDRLAGNNIAQQIMTERVVVDDRNGAYIIRIDSTGPHNHHWVYGHGIICNKVLAQVESALLSAPPNRFVVIALHHHPIELPPEDLFESISSYLGYPFAKELHLGPELMELAKGKADMICHGHRHLLFEIGFHGTRPLMLYNAGCTPRWQKYRVFTYQDGVQTQDVEWVHF